MDSGCGCGSFFLLVFFIFIGLLLSIVVFANPWLFILLIAAVVLAILFQIGAFALDHALTTMLIISIVALFIYLGST
jgi:hypothetical protein